MVFRWSIVMVYGCNCFDCALCRSILKLSTLLIRSTTTNKQGCASLVLRSVGICLFDDLWKTSQSPEVVVGVVVDVELVEVSGLGGQGHSSKIGGLRGPLTQS